jgi:Zn-dependent peptidase ImmA (M78 family)
MALSPVQHAQELRFELGLRGPIDIMKVAESLCIDAYEEALDSVDGLLLRAHGKAIIIINSRCSYETRKRFTIAHEIGHFYMPHHSGEHFQCTAADIARYRSENKFEREANEFASELLLPFREVDKALNHPPSMSTIRGIADLYGTSMTATAVKVAKTTCESVAVVISAAGNIEWAISSPSFRLLLRRGKLHENTYAFDYFVCGALPDSPQQVLASAWCYDALPSQFIKEESIAFHRLGMVLSLLQMPGEEDD